MKAVVLAYHNFGCIGIDALLRNGFEIAAVFTHRDDPTETIWFHSVAEAAASKNLSVFAPDDINHPLWVQRIAAMRPDILFSFFYRKLICSPLLGIPPAGSLNLHASLLPRYRGRCPINWVLVNGEKETGITLHYMTSRPDDGDIVAQCSVPILEEDTALSLSEKLCAVSSTMLDDVLPHIRTGTAPRIPQDPRQATYFGGRHPADGEIDWSRPASEVRDLVRAVTRPYPGAFTHVLGRKCFIWAASEAYADPSGQAPGAVVSLNPLVIACGRGGLRIDLSQPEGGLVMSGAQLASDLHVRGHTRFTRAKPLRVGPPKPVRVLVLGVNGFIGNALTERLLKAKGFEVHGMDLCSDHIEHLLDRRGFHYCKGDISIHREWLEYQVKTCDVVLPLVAIATPIEYVRNPIRVFELDFEENLRVIRYCVKYGKRVVFPSTSEVYGMCDEEEFDEDNSKLVLGPIRMQRWIYSCCKQLLDRVIWAYGKTDGLRFTLFRPFNWIGPKLDTLTSARIGSSRVITQLILNLVEGRPIQLIDGGHQKRCFTDVAEGIECLYRIIKNTDGVCNGRIINIGNPANEVTIRELAGMLVVKFEQHPLRSLFPPFAGFQEVESTSYYGSGYEDVEHRRPSIKNAWRLLGWHPEVGLETSVERTLSFFLHEYLKVQERLDRDGKSLERFVGAESSRATAEDRGIAKTTR